jgi:hypothetical protein
MRRSAVDISDVGFNLEAGKSHNRKWLQATPASNRHVRGSTYGYILEKMTLKEAP